MRPSAVLFDCDGVLVDSEPAAFALLQEEFTAYGLDIAPDEMHRLFMGGTMKTVAATARGMGVALADDWVDQVYERLYARLARGTALIPGVTNVLDRLDAAGIPYAVGSNGTTRKMTITLSQHPDIWRRVRGHLFSGQDLGRPKPDPALYLHAAKVLGVSPETCVVVDDSATGCRAGVAAGMRTLGFAAAGGAAALAETGAEVFYAMEELPGLIGLAPATQVSQVG